MPDKRTIKLIDVTLRDGHQCLWATRMTTAMMTERARTPNSMAVKRGYLMFIILLVRRNRNFMGTYPLSLPSPCGLPH